MTDETVSLAYVSDTHINSTVALCPPIINLDDGGTYHSSRTQKWLWSNWQDYCREISTLPGKKIAVIGGDLGDLDTKRRSSQIITRNPSTVQMMVIDTLEPLLDVCDGLMIFRGTGAHSGKSAWLEEAIAKDIDITIESSEAASWYHMRRKIAGVRYDIAHHAAMGRLPWTQKHAALKVAEIIMWRYCVDMRQDPPQVALRSHNHKYADSGGNYETFAVCAPCWSLATEYAYRTGRENDIADMGGLAFVNHDGVYEFKHWPLELRETRRVWAKSLP